MPGVARKGVDDGTIEPVERSHDEVLPARAEPVEHHEPAAATPVFPGERRDEGQPEELTVEAACFSRVVHGDDHVVQAKRGRSLHPPDDATGHERRQVAAGSPQIGRPAPVPEARLPSLRLHARKLEASDFAWLHESCPMPTGDALSLVPLLVVRDAAGAIEFYVRALRAREVVRFVNRKNGAVSHADLAIGETVFAVTEEARASNSDAPPSLGGSPVVLQLKVDNVDAAFETMCTAGATIVFPIVEFCGERMGRLRDPFGHLWLLIQRVEELARCGLSAPSWVPADLRVWASPGEGPMSAQ